MPSAMPEYDATAGFPQVHIDAFKRVAARLKMVISSRELNPLCTDLVLENYAAKGFHIKAKTCDWGPMAGFVPADPRFTKGSQNVTKQEEDLTKAFGHGARAVPLFISQERFDKLVARKLIVVRTRNANQVSAYAGSTAAGGQKFILATTTFVIPPGAEAPMWGIYYDSNSAPRVAAGHTALAMPVPTEPGLTPVMGMVNPANADGKLGVKSAVAGDYDLWCVFPHETADDIGLGNRAMPLRANLRKTATPLKKAGLPDYMRRDLQASMPQTGPFVKQQAVQAGLVFASGEQKEEMADQLESPNLGNISLGILKVKDALNAECKAAGYTAGNVVQHSDYGANPFGDIDYPLIFFIPKLSSPEVSVRVATNLNELKDALSKMKKLKYLVKLNPAWTVPSF